MNQSQDKTIFTVLETAFAELNQKIFKDQPLIHGLVTDIEYCSNSENCSFCDANKHSIQVDRIQFIKKINEKAKDLCNSDAPINQLIMGCIFSYKSSKSYLEKPYETKLRYSLLNEDQHKLFIKLVKERLESYGLIVTICDDNTHIKVYSPKIYYQYDTKEST